MADYYRQGITEPINDWLFEPTSSGIYVGVVPVAVRDNATFSPGALVLAPRQDLPSSWLEAIEVFNSTHDGLIVQPLDMRGINTGKGPFLGASVGNLRPLCYGANTLNVP